jgi:hypothetical protein
VSDPKAVTFVEVDITYCSRVYGVAPCTAAIGITGSAKCFNTMASCQDEPNFNDSPVTLRFAMDTGYNPSDIEALPVLAGVSISAARISLGEDLGQRESVTLTLRDSPHPDTGPGFDKYASERSYNPFKQGSLWGKFRARHPYMTGRPLRLYRGFVGQALEEMECRNYAIDHTSGPDLDSTFTIVAKDPLKALDGDKALAPAVSSGQLAGSLTNSGTSATLTPTGIGDAEYPASGKIAIGGKEIMSFTRSGDGLTLSNRGSNGTDAIAHSAGDRVQVVLSYTAQSVADIVEDLMTTYGGVDAGLIPLSEWQAEAAAHNRQLYTTIIAEPTPVRKLVSELVEQAGLAIWSDVVAQQIRLQVLRQIPSDSALYDDTIIRRNTLSIEEQPDKRLSRVIVYFAQRNPLGGQTDPSNYRSVRAKADATAEGNYGSPKQKIIYSRWIPFGAASVAYRLIDIQLGRYKDPPRKAGFQVMRSPLEGIELGGGYQLGAHPLQAFDGSDSPMPVQVTSLRSEDAFWVAEVDEINWTSYDSDDLTNRSISIDSNATNVNLRDLHDAIYPAPVAGDEVTFIVPAAVTLGATATSTFAIDTGTWPTATTSGRRTSGNPTLTNIADTSTYEAGMGVTGTGIPAGSKIVSKTSTAITLDHNATSGSSTTTTLTVYLVRITLDIAGTLKGAGGKGGTGAKGAGNVPGTNGAVGGSVLKIRSAIDLILRATARLWSGGGGGGGGTCQEYDDHNGGGGGGGEGFVGGAGGNGPGNAESGKSGSSSNPGAGGRSWTNTTGLIFDGPELENGIRGGSGGDYGEAGHSPGDGPVPAGNGGAAGKSIDGISLAAVDDYGADIRGSQVN